MNEPSFLNRYMDLFHSIDAPEGGDTYEHVANAAGDFTEELGCEDEDRSHFTASLFG